MRKARPSTGALGWALVWDFVLGEPASAVHPVVWIGRLIERGPGELKGQHGAAARLRGGVRSVRVVRRVVGAARVFDGIVHHVPRAVGLPLEAYALTSSFAMWALPVAAENVARALEVGDIDASRAALSSLCSRDASGLGASDLCGAAIASLAENSSDGFVSSMMAYAWGGLPAAWGVRAVNTLDAMVGYKGPWSDAGLVAARLDDLVQYLPARTTALLIVAAARVCGADAEAAHRVMLRDHGRTPSPNGGWPMAAMAGALGVRIEKSGTYVLNAEGRAPTVDDVRRAERIAVVAMWMSAAGAMAFAYARPRRAAR